MGSSCFSRGNRLSLQLIQKYLKDRGLEREVILKGNHCFGECAKGPILKIGSRVFEDVRPGSVLEILENELRSI